MNTSKFALLLASLAAAAPVAAQTEQAVEPTADWQHSKTDLRLAPQIDEFTRDRVVFLMMLGTISAQHIRMKVPARLPASICTALVSKVCQSGPIALQQ